MGLGLVLTAGALAQACASETSPHGAGTPTSHAGGSGGSGGATSSTGAGGSELPSVFTVSGVVTDGSDPVAGAIVMQGGGAIPDARTGADGTFTIELTRAIPGAPTLVAAKEGYRTDGIEFTELPTQPVELVLHIVAPPDNTDYVFGAPGAGGDHHDSSTAYCGHCHTLFTKQFKASKHATSARNPLLQDLYAGVSRAHATESACTEAGGAWRAGLVAGTAKDTTAKCYLGAGVLPDLNPACGGAGKPSCDDPTLVDAKKPTRFGQCADCHAAGIDGKAGGRNLHDAVGLAFEDGNHCDVCHHARDVDLTKPPGAGGALVMQRPSEPQNDKPGAKPRQALFGPLADVPNRFMGGSYQPVFSSSVFCAACHEQKQAALVPGTALDKARWPDGLPTHSTYSEWLDSPLSAAGKPCQTCHMPPDDTGLLSTVDITDATNAGLIYGFVRPPEQIRQHGFRHPLQGSPRLIDGAVSLTLTLTRTGAELSASVSLKNLRGGHAIPTGEPMRQLVLIVRGTGCGTPLSSIGGLTLDELAGAAATGVIGADVTPAGTTWTWAQGAARAKPGDRVRVVRASGAWADYPGIGRYASPTLAPKDKGLPIATSVGEAGIVGTTATGVTLSAAIAVAPGDVAYLGDPIGELADGDAARALAGEAGVVFARVLVDGAGARGVPHYRAIDMVRDNRLPPKVEATTTHAFALPIDCATGELTATLLYRPVPVDLGRERGWSPRDYVIAAATEAVPPP
jgi:hypothetical protein